MAEEQAMVDAGHHDGGVEEIEGRAATDHGDPGYAGAPGRRASPGPGSRDRAHAAAGRPGADPRRPRRHHQHATHTIPDDPATARHRTSDEDDSTTASILAFSEGHARDRAIAACRRRRKPAAHPHGSRFRDSTSAGHRCRGGVRPVRCGTHSHGRADGNGRKRSAGQRRAPEQPPSILHGRAARTPEGSRSIGAGGSDRQGELLPTSGSRLVLCTSGSATMTT